MGQVRIATKGNELDEDMRKRSKQHKSSFAATYEAAYELFFCRVYAANLQIHYNNSPLPLGGSLPSLDWLAFPMNCFQRSNLLR